jgi:hypothetical protein
MFWTWRHDEGNYKQQKNFNNNVNLCVNNNSYDSVHPFLANRGFARTQNSFRCRVSKPTQMYAQCTIASSTSLKAATRRCVLNTLAPEFYFKF